MFHLIGLARAEREQGITIDVAHRYFATANRFRSCWPTPRPMLATRNMVTENRGVFALVLVDAARRQVEQTRRHAAVAGTRVRHVALAEQMGLVGFDEQVFTSIRDEFASLPSPGATTSSRSCLAPGSGDTSWGSTDALVRRDYRSEHLESVPMATTSSSRVPVPVQYVIRPQTAEHYDHRA